MAEIARDIKNSATVARSIVGKVLTTYGVTGELYERELGAANGYFQKHFGVAVVNRAPLGLSAMQLAKASAQVELRRKLKYLHAKVIAVRTVKSTDNIGRQIETTEKSTPGMSDI
jgi:hypothetical protein